MTTAKQIGSDKAELDALLAEQCPGPHVIIRHGDGRPAWCWACGKTRLGTNIANVKARRRPDLEQL